MKVGSRPTTQVEILKMKKGRATVIEVFGKRYVLDMKSENRRNRNES